MGVYLGGFLNPGGSWLDPDAGHTGALLGNGTRWLSGLLKGFVDRLCQSKHFIMGVRTRMLISSTNIKTGMGWHICDPRAGEMETR